MSPAGRILEPDICGLGVGNTLEGAFVVNFVGSVPAPGVACYFAKEGTGFTGFSLRVVFDLVDGEEGHFMNFLYDSSALFRAFLN